MQNQQNTITFYWTGILSSFLFFSIQGRNKLSNMFTTLTKEQTAEDNTTTSHGLLLKGGFVRQV